MILLCVFLLSGCSDDDDDLPVEFVVAPGTLEPTETADTFGPCAVGHQRSEVIDATPDNQRLPYDVWYPVDAAGFARTPNPAATYQVDTFGATHTHSANICDIANALTEGGLGPDLWPAIGAAALIALYEDTCSETSFPLDVAQRIQNLSAVAFFRRHLNGEHDYDFYLKSEYAADNLPNVEYSARTTE